MADGGGGSAPPDITRRTRKAALREAGWNPTNDRQLNEGLQSLVQRVNLVVAHTFLLARFIFLRLFEGGQRDFEPLVKTEFFAEVFHSLTTRRVMENVSFETAARRRLIYEPRRTYMEASSFRLVELRNGGSIATYEARSICTAYLNNVQEHLGQHLRATVNSLLRVKERSAEMRERLRREERSEAAIQRTLVREIYAPARRIKGAMARLELIVGRVVGNIRVEVAAVNDLVATLRACYADGYRFDKGSIYYDAKAHPGRHLGAMIALAAFRERRGMQEFQPLPLRTGWVPASILIDTRIAAQHLLGWKTLPKLTQKVKKKVWRRLFDTKRRIFKEEHGRAFRGMLQTGGINVCIIKQDSDSRYGCGRKRKRPPRDDEYLEDMPREELNATKFVLADPGRRDLMYCMHEDSRPDAPHLFRYTSNQLAKDSRRRELRKARDERKARDSRIAEHEEKLVGYRRCTADGFLAYVRARRAAEPYLLQAYAHPQWRQLRLEGYVAQQRADARLECGLKEAFGTEVTLVYGNWSRPNQRYHEPLAGVGLVRKVRRMGLPVVYIDEFRTSTFCPRCGEDVGLCKVVINPRPYRRVAQALVPCHGLLRCTNQTCRQACGGRCRLWNRDLLAVLNFLHILNGLRKHGERPDRFRRQGVRRN